VCSLHGQDPVRHQDLCILGQLFDLYSEPGREGFVFEAAQKAHKLALEQLAPLSSFTEPSAQLQTETTLFSVCTAEPPAVLRKKRRRRETCNARHSHAVLTPDEVVEQNNLRGVIKSPRRVLHQLLDISHCRPCRTVARAVRPGTTHDDVKREKSRFQTTTQGSSLLDSDSHSSRRSLRILRSVSLPS
jgi:hypothetical protein